MTVPTSVAISSLATNLVPATQLVTNSTLQLPNSCVSLVSSATANITLPISIRTSLANSQPSTTMSWTQSAPIQLATQRTNGTISLIPQQILQMPNDVLQVSNSVPQMLLTQQRPSGQQQTNNQNPHFTGQTPPGSIVQIIQTANGSTQLVSTSNLKSNITLSNNTSNNNLNNNSNNSRSNKQILPKPTWKNQTLSTQKNTIVTCNSSTSISANSTNKSTTSTTNSKTILTSLPTNSLNQQLTTPIMFSNSQTGFLTSNGTILLSNQIQLPTLNQQPFLIQSGLPNQMTTGTGTMQLTLGKSQNNIISNNSNNLISSNLINSQSQKQTSANQTIIIPNSSTTTTSLKNQNIILAKTPDVQPVIPQNPTTQLLQIQTANGPMLVALQQPQPTSDAQQTILQALPNTQTLQLIQPTNQSTDGQGISYPGNNIIISSQPSITNFITTTTNTTTTATTKVKTTRKKVTYKKKTTEANTVSKITPSKGLNLAELLKETGIIESSPPSSPHVLPQSQQTEIVDQNINNNTQLASIDYSDQHTTLLGTQNTSLQQPTVVMLPTNNTSSTNYFLAPNQLTNVSNSNTTQPQLKLAFAPDGSMILQTVSPYTQPNLNLSQSNTTVQSTTTSKFIDSSKDSCGPGSSQPSPDSTTPTLDAATTPTSSSSLSITTSTITFTTNSISNNNSSNSQLMNSGSSIKLTDSISLTIQNNGTVNEDNSNKFQTTIVPITTKTDNKKTKAKEKKENKKVKKQTLKQPVQQLITIPIQTNINSSINPIIPNENTPMIQIGNSNIINNSTSSNLSIKKNDSNVSLATTLDQNGIPVVQISLNNQEFLERLETQIKSLSSIKSPTQQQKTLLQELLSLQKKMMQAKSNVGDASGPEANIILTSQPLISQQNDLNSIQTNKTIITPIKQPKDNILNVTHGKTITSTSVTSLSTTKTSTSLTNNTSNTGTQIIAITSKQIDSQNKTLTTSNLTLDTSKNQNSSTTMISQPAQIIFQSSPSIKTSDQNSQNKTSSQPQIQLINADQQTNTFDNQKIKILTTNTNLTTQSTAQTFQVGNQLFTITSAGKNPLQAISSNQLNDGSPAPTVYQVVTLQPTQNTNTMNNMELLNTTKFVKIPTDNTTSNIPDTYKNKSKSKFSFQQQLVADQTAATKPDTKTPFKNRSDACKRLLRYHVYHQENLKEDCLQKFDNDFEILSRHLIYKKEQLFRRFRLQLLKLTMKTHSTAENIMLDKSFICSESVCLKDDKESVAQGKILDLPLPPLEWREEIKASLDEEESKLNQSRKRKSEETNDLDFIKIKKTDISHLNGNEDEDSNEENINEINDFKYEFKYLDNIDTMDDLSNLYNNSNSYSSMMQMTEHQSNHQVTQENMSTHEQHTNDFQIFEQDWRLTNNNETIKSGWNQEDANAVESILANGENDNGTHLDLNSLPNLPNLGDEDNEEYEEDDEEDDDDDEDDVEDDLNTNNQINTNNLVFNQKSEQMDNIESDLANDMQMESAINSILDILVTPNTENNLQNESNENLQQNDVGNNPMMQNNQQLSSNGYNFNEMSPNSTVSFRQNNYINTPMQNMLPNRQNLINDFGNDSVLDEAVKSILS